MTGIGLLFVLVGVPGWVYGVKRLLLDDYAMVPLLAASSASIALGVGVWAF